MTDAVAPAAPRHHHHRTHRWLAIPLAAAAIWLAALTPTPSVPPPNPAAAVTAPAPINAGSIPVNELTAVELTQRVPGIGPAYADRIVAHRLLFGPIEGPETLRDLGIPRRVVDAVGPRLRFGT